MSEGRRTDERRRYPRTPVSWPARLWVDESTIIGHTVDVSPYGLCVLTAPTAAVKVGHAYRVEVVAGMADPFTVVGEVRHVRDRSVGMETREPLPVSWSALAQGR